MDRAPTLNDADDSSAAGRSATVRASASRPSLLGLIAFLAVLYLGRELLLPVVLAALLSFLLAPVVKGLERLHLNRVLSVVIVTLAAFAIIGGTAFLIGKQLGDLAMRLPDYKANLVRKVADLKPGTENPVTRAMTTIDEIATEARSGDDSSAPAAAGGAAKKAAEPQPPVKVEVVDSPQKPLENLAAWLRPVARPMGQAAVVVVLVIFMLLGREDVRDRLIHLAGRTRLRLTTQALNDAGRRVSRYLVAQTLVNAGYAVAAGIGLFFIGIPNAPLWGIMFGLLRFLPYVGPWIGAAGPILLSLAISESWHQPLLVLGLFAAIELIGNNVIEPWAFGSSTGLYPLAIIIAALFWTWLWGALGLVLATPLTVCAMVVGQHVPRLRFLYVLLSDSPPISTADRVYQRLLAFDADEAMELVENETNERSLAEAFDQTTLPALRAEETEFHGGLMPAADRERLFSILRQLVGAIGDANQAETIKQQPILCLPASSEADELAALMLQQALRARGLVADVPSHRQLIAEMVSAAREQGATNVVVSMLAPGSALAGVSLCRRLRAAVPGAFIVAGVWIDDAGPADERLRTRLEKSGVNVVCPTLERAVATLTTVVA